MKIICAWCQKLIGYTCPLCGEPLRADPLDNTTMICPTGSSALKFIAAQMQTSHGICHDCAEKQKAQSERSEQRQLTGEDKANLSALDGAGNRGETPQKGKRK